VVGRGKKGGKKIGPVDEGLDLDDEMELER